MKRSLMPEAAITAIESGNRNRAFGIVRRELGVSLSQAKDMVYDYESKSKGVPASDLRKAQARHERGGCGIILVLIAVVVGFFVIRAQSSGGGTAQPVVVRPHVVLAMNLTPSKQGYKILTSRPFVIPKGIPWGVGWAYNCVSHNGRDPGGYASIWLEVAKKAGIEAGAPTLVNDTAPNNTWWHRGFSPARGSGGRRYLGVIPEDWCAYHLIVTEGNLRRVPSLPTHPTLASVAPTGHLSAHTKAQVASVLNGSINHYLNLLAQGKAALGNTQYNSAQEGLAAFNDPNSAANKISHFRTGPRPEYDVSYIQSFGKADSYYNGNNEPTDQISRWENDMGNVQVDLSTWVQDAVSWQIKSVGTAKLSGDERKFYRDIQVARKDISQVLAAS
jgi:hypothetical protein